VVSAAAARILSASSLISSTLGAGIPLGGAKSAGKIEGLSTFSPESILAFTART
jgi:hypothetical protein